MKNLVVVLMLLVLNCSIGFAQNSDLEKIKVVVDEFARAGDANDSELLANYLDGNFRVVMNRLFNGKDVIVMPRSVYLDNIKSKKLGGDSRTVIIQDILINGTTSTVKVLLKGNKMTFTSLLTLVKDKSNNWKLISDMPFINK